MIRGAGSILGQNQPLFIIDGVPMSNSDFSTATAGGGRDYGSAHLRPEHGRRRVGDGAQGPERCGALWLARIERRGRHHDEERAQPAGAGRSSAARAAATYDTPTLLPSYQNQYGQGFGGEFQYVDGAGSGVNDGADESWGPKLDGRLIDQFNGKRCRGSRIRTTSRTSSRTAPRCRTTSPCRRRSTMAVSASRSTKDDQKGIIPFSTSRSSAGTLSANYTPFEKMQVPARSTTRRTRRPNRAENGYTEGNPLMSFTWFGRQVDLDLLKTQYYNTNSPYGFADGSLFNWNDNYHRNPYWQFDDNRAPDSRDHIIAQASANYEFSSWLSGLRPRRWRQRPLHGGGVLRPGQHRSRGSGL